MNGMQAFQKRTIALMILSGALMATGCKKAVPVQNSDGTVTNPNGSVHRARAGRPAGHGGAQSRWLHHQPRRLSHLSRRQQGRQPRGRAQRACARARSCASRWVYPCSARAHRPRHRTRRNADRHPHQRRPRRQPATIPATTSAAYSTARSSSTARRSSPPAQAVSGEVVASKGKGRFKGAGDLGIQLTNIGRERVATSEYEKVSPGRGASARPALLAAARGLGAIIGGIAGGGKGALIGGLAGGAGGTAAGAYTGSRDVVIPAESLITFRLTEAISH